LFGDRVYIPVMEEQVDVVLYDPYGKCWSWVEGSSLEEVFRRKIMKRAPVWAHVKHYVAPVDKAGLGEFGKETHWLYTIAHHRPRYYATTVRGKDSPPDAFLIAEGGSPAHRKRMFRRNVEAVAFMMAVSARRNFLLSSGDANSQKAWARRGGNMRVEDIYSLRAIDFLGRPTRITNRKVRGRMRKFGAGADVIKVIQDNFGDVMVSYEVLKQFDVGMHELQRLVMIGSVAVSVRMGTSYYGVVPPHVDMVWDVPSVAPTVVFADTVVAQYDTPLGIILPVPVSVRELLQMYHAKFPVARDLRVYSEGDHTSNISQNT